MTNDNLLLAICCQLAPKTL